MKSEIFFGWFCAFCLSVVLVRAQETGENEKFSRQIKELQQNFEKQQRDMRESFEKMIHEQQTQIEALKKQLTEAPAILPPAAPADNYKPWSPSDPARLAGNMANYMNISFDALTAAGTSTAKDVESLQLGGHDPNQRGFTVQNLELTFDGKIDPYFRGQANVVMQLNPRGETTLEVEEAWLETMSLPANLQVRGGMLLSEFGRINGTHPHTWDFVDQPLIMGRVLGPDGLRNPGVRVSWLVPTPYYSELFFSVQNSQGGIATSFRNDYEGNVVFGRLHSQTRVKSLGDLLFVPRYAMSFDLTDSQTIVAGTSAAFGPNGSGEHSETQIYGVDLFYKWKSPRQHGGFPFVTWQTEGMLRRFQAAASATVDLNGDGVLDFVSREMIEDYGFYSQLAYGFRKGWVAALRGDYIVGEQADYEKRFGRDVDRGDRWRVSPNLTWYPSEFSKIRLQYNLDRRELIGIDHSVWLQFEFLLGSHAAHKF